VTVAEKETPAVMSPREGTPIVIELEIPTANAAASVGGGGMSDRLASYMNRDSTDSLRCLLCPSFDQSYN
jgi:hypothetical protein